MSMKTLVPLLLGFMAGHTSQIDTNIEILPADCDCRDWYGACRHEGDVWTDDATWMYECKGTNGTDARFVACATPTGSKEAVPVGQNRTVESLWHSCEANEQRLKYDSEPHCVVDGQIKKVRSEFRDGRFQWLCLETGRWVVGCFYANETHPDVYLKIGEHGYNGLIKHVCDRFEDYPGRVQYYAEVRKDVHVKHPTNKGINKNFPEPADLRIKNKVDRWLHESASMFIANEETLRGKVRYLPASRRQWPTGEH
ncbi:hypothetical protein Y032_0499g2569 [Ancylostoma ceylanicum]|uniref:Uncharacterized protein n=1 Tax=Ancylostoma ceylanicum TaxID=53326 RepID=A0A016WVE7_9BILA|nr:hypothetical protein Y032_0499g2569 [Ancylostoma ceylanicum]